MNKDALLATLIGFGIGLFITAMLLVGPKLVAMLPKINLPNFTSQKATPKTTPKPQEFFVTIDSPLPDSIEETDEVLVSGTTMKGATVVIQGNVDDAAAVIREDGKYAGKITLVEGRNEISVTSYLTDKIATQSVTVFYTPEEF